MNIDKVKSYVIIQEPGHDDALPPRQPLSPKLSGWYFS